MDVLRDVLSNEDLGKIDFTRNVLSHRAAPGRIINLMTADAAAAGAVQQDDEWVVLGISLNRGTLQHFYDALVALLTTLLEGAEVFVRTRLAVAP